MPLSQPVPVSHALQAARSAVSAAADTGATGAHALALPAEGHSAITNDLASIARVFEQTLQAIQQASQAASSAAQCFDLVTEELTTLAALPPAAAAPPAAQADSQQPGIPTADISNRVAAGEAAATAAASRLPLRSLRLYTPV